MAKLSLHLVFPIVFSDLLDHNNKVFLIHLLIRKKLIVFPTNSNNNHPKKFLLCFILTIIVKHKLFEVDKHSKNQYNYVDLVER